MDTQDYMIAWLIYALAGAAFSVLSWRFLRSLLWREMAYLLQSLLMAVIFTPWYVLPEEDILAPAVIVFLLDLVTIDITTSIRSLIPLVMAMLLAIAVTVVLSLLYRIRQKKAAGSTLDDGAEA